MNSDGAGLRPWVGEPKLRVGDSHPRAEIGKPVAPQTASVGVSTTKFVRNEGAVIRHNMGWTFVLLVYLTLIKPMLAGSPVATRRGGRRQDQATGRGAGK
jgi:hypothetical protein